MYVVEVDGRSGKLKKSYPIDDLRRTKAIQQRLRDDVDRIVNKDFQVPKRLKAFAKAVSDERGTLENEPLVEGGDRSRLLTKLMKGFFTQCERKEQWSAAASTLQVATHVVYLRAQRGERVSLTQRLNHPIFKCSEFWIARKDDPLNSSLTGQPSNSESNCSLLKKMLMKGVKGQSESFVASMCGLMTELSLTLGGFDLGFKTHREIAEIYATDLFGNSPSAEDQRLMRRTIKALPYK